MKNKRIQALILTGILSAGILTGCAGKTDKGTNNTGNSAKPDTSKEVNLVYYLWGGEGTANKDIINEINKKLKADINATIEVKYIDWGDVDTKYPLLFASGEKFDMSHASPSAAVPYSTLATQGVLTDITTMLDTVAPKLKAEIPEKTWEASKVNGKIYGVQAPYSEFTPYGFVYSRNLKEKYGLGEINSIESMEAYMDAVAKNEKFAPLNGDSSTAQNLYRLFIGNTGKWIKAPGMPSSQMYLVATSPEKYNDIIHPAFTQEFEDWAVKMHEWAAKGYWPKDILSSQQGDKPNFNNGLSGAFITHMTDWTGNYGSLKASQPNVETDFWSPEETNGKILSIAGMQSSTVISSNSKNPERALMAIEKLMTDESYYRLMQYGIEGRQYVIEDGLVKKPANFDKDKDSGGFSAWALRNDRLNIPYASEDPRRYELIEKWKGTSLSNPYIGFNFDAKNVTTELASIANVSSQIGNQIMLGKTKDPKAAVQQYRSQLKQAGIDKVIEELKSQLANFTPVK